MFNVPNKPASHIKRLYEFAMHLPPMNSEVLRMSVWKAIQSNYYEQGNHSKNATLALDTVKPQIFLIYSLLILKLQMFSAPLVGFYMEMPYWCTVLVHQHGRQK